jgi:hypothetical protein
MPDVRRWRGSTTSDRGGEAGADRAAGTAPHQVIEIADAEPVRSSRSARTPLWGCTGVATSGVRRKMSLKLHTPMGGR